MAWGYRSVRTHMVSLVAMVADGGECRWCRSQIIIMTSWEIIKTGLDVIRWHLMY